MSVKIYNGYLLADSVDLFDLREVFARMVMYQHKIDVSSETVTEAFHIYDQITLGSRKLLNTVKEQLRLTKWDGSPIDKLNYCMHYAVLKNFLNKSKNSDPYAELVVVWSKTTGKMGALFYGSDELEKKFKKLPEVTRYNYWNNSDRPKKCSKKEWEERRDFWNDVLGNSYAPSNTLGYRLTPEVSPMLSRGDIFKILATETKEISYPTLEGRKYYAEESLVYREAERRMKLAGEKEGHKIFEYAYPVREDNTFMTEARRQVDLKVREITLQELINQ